MSTEEIMRLKDERDSLVMQCEELNKALCQQLKKIEELNPAAAANIRDQLARKKAAKK